MGFRESKKVLLFLEKREVYLLEKFIEAGKKGKEAEVVKEMEWESKDREKRRVGGEIAKRSWPTGVSILIIFVLLLSFFSVKNPAPEIKIAGVGSEGGKGKILISYFFDAEYLELRGYDWNFVSPIVLSRIKFATFHIAFGGQNWKKVKRTLNQVLYESDDWRVRSRIFYLLARISFAEKKNRQAYEYAKKALDEIKFPVNSPLSYDPLTLILEILYRDGKYDEMKKYMDIALSLLQRDFFYPLFKYTAFYLMEKESGTSFYMSYVIGTINRMAENFPSNLKLSSDFIQVLDRGSTPIFLFAKAIIYKALGDRHKTKTLLKEFIKNASRNPAKYSTFIISARRLASAI